MAISYIGGTAGAANQTTTCTITTNVTTQADDVLLLAFTNGGADTDPTSITGTLTTTGGLTFQKVQSLGGAATTDLNGSLWWARASGNHTGQTAIGNGFTNSSAGVYAVFRGVIASGNPYTASATQVLNASGTNTLTAVDAAGVRGCWVILTLCTDDNIASTSAGATDPAAVTDRIEHLSAGGNDTGACIKAEALGGIGSTGAFSWTNGRGAGLYQVAMANLLTSAVQDLAPAGATVTITDGTPSFDVQAPPVTQRGVTRARIGWIP